MLAVETVAPASDTDSSAHATNAPAADDANAPPIAEAPAPTDRPQAAVDGEVGIAIESAQPAIDEAPAPAADQSTPEPTPEPTPAQTPEPTAEPSPTAEQAITEPTRPPAAPLQPAEPEPSPTEPAARGFDWPANESGSLAAAPTDPPPTAIASKRKANFVRFVTIVALTSVVLMILFVALPHGRSQTDARLFVAATLDMPFSANVEHESITSAEYADRMATDMAEPAAQRALADEQALYASLGLLTPKQDLDAAMRRLLAEAPASYYDLDKQRIVVVEDPGKTTRAVLAYDYTVALLDQRLSLRDRRERATTDRRLAERAFVSGVASLVEAAFMTGSLDGLRTVTNQPSAVLEERYLAKADERKQPEEMPAIVVDTIYYRFVTGYRYAHGLARRDVRGEAWLEWMPESTEQLARMEATWLGHRDRPVTVEAPAVVETFLGGVPAGEHWRAGKPDTWGHWFLTQWLDRSRVSWDGDRVYTFYRDRDGAADGEAGADTDSDAKPSVPIDVALVMLIVMDKAAPDARHALVPSLARAVPAQLLQHTASGKLVEACFDGTGARLPISATEFAAQALDGSIVWSTDAGRVSAIEVVGQDVFAIMNVPTSALNELRAACFARTIADVHVDDYSTEPPPTLTPRAALTLP